MHSKDGSIEYECSAIYTAGAESAPNSQSTNNDNKQRKRERERARYAAMSQEEKNARNLRLREAHQKKRKVMDALHICDVTNTLPCNLDG